MDRVENLKNKVNKLMKKRKSSNDLVYSGEVTITYPIAKNVYKTTKLHNEGRTHLFDFLAKCIAGDFNGNDAPTCIRLFHTDKDGKMSEQTSTFIPYSDRTPLTDKTHSRVVLKFLVPFTAIPVVPVDKRTSDTVIDTVCIYSYNTSSSSYWDEPHAIFKFADGKGFWGDGVSNILITWTMTVANAKEN